MWTDEARAAHEPRTERYPSDMTVAEWAIIEPMIPPPRTGGRPRTSDMREVMNGVRYVRNRPLKTAVAETCGRGCVG